MASLNKVLLIGNLTRDPELRYTPSGMAVTNLGLAVNRKFKNKNGELKEETCFITVVSWGKQAEVCNQYLQKGRPVCVEGRLQSRSWETKEGQKRNTIEVQAERIQFLGTGKGVDVAAANGPADDVPGTDLPGQETKLETASWDEEENVV
ncbi:MAG TPA: single-stranded DNA-binding protein [Candidatus Omnitrophota bacterium]|nr:single-stranded DNA-binding protein [Candidatus Omnitrophota bacterium]HPD84308.1 single-stranded DNA-binding protein [Candidatus Omnitrophota bacterium]HRZ03165.1 single-stranded DNA-binding protein [Candidatus Omnitrophota bacterium]